MKAEQMVAALTAEVLQQTQEVCAAGRDGGKSSGWVVSRKLFLRARDD